MAGPLNPALDLFLRLRRYFPGTMLRALEKEKERKRMRRGKRIRKKGEDGRHYDERDKVDRTMGGVLEKKNIAVQSR